MVRALLVIKFDFFKEISRNKVIYVCNTGYCEGILGIKMALPVYETWHEGRQICMSTNEYIYTNVK